MITLRFDQQQLKQAIYDNWNVGMVNALAELPAVLAVLPTGGGKSIIVSDIVLDNYLKNECQVVIAHRNELVSQMSMHLARRGIYHRIIASDKTVKQCVRKHRKEFGKSFVNPSSRTAVIGVDTLMSRADKLKDWAAQVRYWIIDEAHHVLRANKWGKAVAMFPRAFGLGVTATPCRADGEGLGRDFDGVFTSMVIGIDMRSLINIGALSDYEIVCPTSDLEMDEDDVSANGDWSNKKLREAVKKTESRIVGDVVKAYCSFAYGRSAIVFATDVETANDIARRFNAVGIRAAALSADTDPDVREKYVDEFKAGTLRVLVNVDLFDEGFDVPACDVVIMARPTASLGKYRQMVGRALRYVFGKTALIIDLVSNVVRHGFPDKPIAWTLGRREKNGRNKKDPEELALIGCKNPMCMKPYEAFRVCCPHCGHSQPLPEPTTRTIKMVEGDLILLTREKLEAMRNAMFLESPADVGNRAPSSPNNFIATSHMNRQIEKIASHTRLKETIAQWAGIEKHKGLNDREIQRKFFLTLGVDVLTALSGSQTRAELDQLNATIQGWYIK